MPLIIPEGYELERTSVATESKAIKLSYVSISGQNSVLFLQGKANDEFKPANSAILGKVGESTGRYGSRGK